MPGPGRGAKEPAFNKKEQPIRILVFPKEMSQWVGCLSQTLTRLIDRQ
jgi:hypothetical protein